MKKEIRKENKIKRALKRIFRRGKYKKNIIYKVDMQLPRKIRRNRTRILIRKDGVNKVNKAMKYYWNDVQAGRIKI